MFREAVSGGSYVIQKLFPYGELSQEIKFTRNTLLEIIRRKNDGWTTYQACKIAGINIRRVNQIWKDYQETKAISDLGKKNRKPIKPVIDTGILFY